MKAYLFYCLLFLAFPFAACAQSSKDSIATYLKNPTIPEFSILTTDSTAFTKSDLPKNKTVILIYFSPDCSHCQYEAKQIVQYMDSFKNVYFLWVSYHPLNEIKDFFIKYGLDKFKNITVGRDTKYFIPAYYKVESTPFIAVYNQKGTFTKEFREGAKAEELIQAVK